MSLTHNQRNRGGGAHEIPRQDPAGIGPWGGESEGTLVCHSRRQQACNLGNLGLGVT